MVDNLINQINNQLSVTRNSLNMRKIVLSILEPNAMLLEFLKTFTHILYWRNCKKTANYKNLSFYRRKSERFNMESITLQHYKMSKI